MNTLGIDYGSKYIGVAISEGIFATPLTTIFRGEALERLKHICKEKEVIQIIMGLPEGRVAGEAKTFGKLLSKTVSVPVTYYPETLTSKTAMVELTRLKTQPKKRHEKEHAVAAALLLETYFKDIT